MMELMELLQWHKVCEIGGEELHRPPVVALRRSITVFPAPQDSYDLSGSHSQYDLGRH